jgi:hypothetical protein
MVDYNFNLQALEGVHQPMITAANILRGLVAGLVDRLFSGKPPANKRAPALTSFLTPIEARALGELHIWKLKTHPNTRPTAAIPKDKENRSKVTLKDLVTRSITGEIDAREWQTVFQNRLVQALGGGAQGSGLPQDLDPLVEKAAWDDLLFRRALASRVKEYLRERVLFIPGEPWMPRFSAGAFWALIGLSETGEAPGQRAFINMVAAIRDEARRHVLHEGWAGFWDQWLIRVARDQWPLAFEQDTDMFSRALLALPLVTRRSAAFPEKMPHIPKLTLLDWLKKWMPTFFGFIKTRTPGKVKRAENIISLAHPDWEGQIPVFFKEVKSNV